MSRAIAGHVVDFRLEELAAKRLPPEFLPLQAEMAAADMTDTLLALLLPGAGDELQGLKRGLLEVVDLIAVNKADGSARAAAELAAQQLRNALHASSRPGGPPPVVLCSALSGEGIPEIWQAIADHQARLAASGGLAAKRHGQHLHWLCRSSRSGSATGCSAIPPSRRSAPRSSARSSPVDSLPKPPPPHSCGLRYTTRVNLRKAVANRLARRFT